MLAHGHEEIEEPDGTRELTPIQKTGEQQCQSQTLHGTALYAYIDLSNGVSGIWAVTAGGYVYVSKKSAKNRAGDGLQESALRKVRALHSSHRCG